MSMLRKRRALLVTLLFAGFCALLLQVCVYTDFERLRFGVVREAQPASGRALNPSRCLTCRVWLDSRSPLSCVWL